MGTVWRPNPARRQVALVDGNNHQIDRIDEEAQTRVVDLAIVVDLIHVLAYLWGAVWCFFAEGDLSASAWSQDRALAVLSGNARKVAAGISPAVGLDGVGLIPMATSGRRIIAIPEESPA